MTDPMAEQLAQALQALERAITPLMADPKTLKLSPDARAYLADKLNRARGVLVAYDVEQSLALAGDDPPRGRDTFRAKGE